VRQRTHGARLHTIGLAVPYDARVLDLKVFKAYDVRGVYPTELDEDGAYRVGRAYVEEFEPRTIAVGRDMRLSSPAMTAAVIEGAADAGADVLDLGLVGTEMLYYAVGDLALDGGICVTASHNPGEYTGMKIVRRGARPVGGDSGLDRVRGRAEAGFGDVVRRGEVRAENVWDGFVAKVLSFVDEAAFRPLRIVVDAANGMAGTMLPPVLERLPQLDVVRCYFEPDGSFPNHEPNPLLPENRAFIVERTRAEGAQLGVAYDGDADRCFFVDDAGEFVPGDFVTALLAQAMLAKEPGAKVIYDVRASWAVPRVIEEAGGVPLINRVGHAFIKERMRKEDALFAGEVSAHYYFRDFSQADTGVVPFLVMVELLSRAAEPLSELLAPFRERYFLTGELNTPVADVALKLQELKERYAKEGGRVTHLDGISVDFDEWHFNVRPSNTEPLLRLNLEALSEPLMEEKRDEVLDLIRS
jgi:phosphomannomutase